MVFRHTVQTKLKRLFWTFWQHMISQENDTIGPAFSPDANPIYLIFRSTVQCQTCRQKPENIIYITQYVWDYARLMTGKPREECVQMWWKRAKLYLRAIGWHFLASTFWRQDVLAPNRFGADTFWRQDILAPDFLAPGRFSAKHIIRWDIWLRDTFALMSYVKM